MTDPIRAIAPRTRQAVLTEQQLHFSMTDSLLSLFSLENRRPTILFKARCCSNQAWSLSVELWSFENIQSRHDWGQMYLTSNISIALSNNSSVWASLHLTDLTGSVQVLHKHIFWNFDPPLAEKRWMTYQKLGFLVWYCCSIILDKHVSIFPFDPPVPPFW